MERPRRFDGRQCGLWQSVVAGGEIKRDAWRNAAASGEIVGTCRNCGGYVVPDDPSEYNDIPLQWYVARCLECGGEVAAPGGRVGRNRGKS